jgi:outer membrane protein
MRKPYISVLRGQPKMIGRFCRVTLAVCLAILTGLAPVAPAFAQDQGQPAPTTQPQAEPQPQAPARTIQISNQNYTFGKPWFPHVFAPYTPTPVPEPVLTNGPRIDQMIKDGKLTISLQDAIDLALQNNLDLTIQRYTPWLAEANILRTMSGGAGVGGTVSALGTIPAQNFDPQLTSSWSIDDKDIPVNNPLTAGTGASQIGLSQLKTHTTIGDIAYSQGFHTGTSFSAAFDNTRASTTSGSVLFSPSVQSNFVFIASQELLNGYGLLANEHYIRIAKVNKSIADQTFQQQVITSITAVGNAYWELVFARGNVDVAKEEIELANKLYSDNKKQVDIGTLAPLEIVQAEAQVATANQALIVAQTTVLVDQLTLLNLISKDPNSPALRTVEIIPTNMANTAPPEVEKIPLEDLITEAITKRPDVLQAGLAIKGDDINVRATKNALLPVLTLSAEYATEGLSGNSKALGTPVTTASKQGVVDASGNPVSVLTSPAGTPIPIFIPSTTTPVTGIDTSGLGAALSETFRGVYPEYNAAVTLTIPIRNRAAQANNVTALLDQRADESRYRQTVNNAAIDVHNAQITLEQARITLQAAIKTRDLDQQTLDAEQKKLQLGASTLFNVVSDQNTLVAAESAEVRARVNLVEGKVNFDRAMARTLEVYNITIADAKSGTVPKDTLIPGTSASGQLIVDPAKQPAPSAAAASPPSAVAKK